MLAALPALGRVAFPRPTQSRMQAKGSSSPLPAGKTTPNPTAAPGSPAPTGLTHPAEPPLSLPKPRRVGDRACLSCCPAPSVPTLGHQGGGTEAAPTAHTARGSRMWQQLPRDAGQLPGCRAAPLPPPSPLALAWEGQRRLHTLPAQPGVSLGHAALGQLEGRILTASLGWRGGCCND